MHMRKRSLCVLATIALAISTVTVGCGGSASSSQTQQQEATEPTTEETQAADAGQNEAEAPAETEAAPQADAAAQPEATAATEPAAQPEATAATEPAAQPEATAAAEPAAKPAPAPAPAPEPEPELPRSPLTGKVMDEELLKQRPLAVMYPINQQAQPQYGLDRVDVFYEIMEEGSMSRQMGIMQDWQGLDRIGNIRSIRSYFVYEALEWDPIILHFGGPVDYTGEILTREDVDNINGVGGIMGPDYGAYYRVPHDGVAIEHTAYTDSENVNDAIEEAGFEKEHREGYYHEKHFTMVEHRWYNYVVQGMRQAVLGGTCRAANLPGIEVCGKTGTAQNRGHDHSAFIGFAPMNDPKIAIAVYVENGGFGADFGVPIGAVMMEQYLNGKLSAHGERVAEEFQHRHISYGTGER